MSRYCILALGSRGDVQPFIALARELMARSHRVVIAAAEDYGDLVRGAGCEFAPLVGRIAEHMDRSAVAASLDGGTLGSLQLARQLRKQAVPLLKSLLRDAVSAAQGSDILIVATLGQYIGYSVSEVLGGLPVAFAHVHPVAPSRYYADVFFPPCPLPGLLTTMYNRATHWVGRRALWLGLLSALNQARRTLGLPGFTWRTVENQLKQQGRALQLYAYSPLLAPPPLDWNPQHQIVTGFWHRSRTDQSLTPELKAFLEAGPPPVYIGFGSILAGRDPDGMTRLLIEALNRAGMRGVLYRGWGDLGNIDLPSTVLAIRGAPHDALFPRCAVVVHHGGSGTTYAALHAGTPAVVLPIFGDQFFWGQRLHEQGASPTPIPRRGITAQNLAGAIVAARDIPGFRKQTKRLQNALREENGVVNAATILEEWRASVC